MREQLRNVRITLLHYNSMLRLCVCFFLHIFFSSCLLFIMMSLFWLLGWGYYDSRLPNTFTFVVLLFFYGSMWRLVANILGVLISKSYGKTNIPSCIEYHRWNVPSSGDHQFWRWKKHSTPFVVDVSPWAEPNIEFGTFRTNNSLTRGGYHLIAMDSVS